MFAIAVDGHLPIIHLNGAIERSIYMKHDK
jgi:hypothetical protein